jgi:hypothetical protein
MVLRVLRVVETPTENENLLIGFIGLLLFFS